jgi:ribonucleoside-diphosphate reductase beta chain
MSISKDGIGVAPSYRRLYYDWEHEQWEAGAIDLAEDRRQWRVGLGSDIRDELLDTVSFAYAAAEQITRGVAAFVDAAPLEEQQVFLTTQLADAARHIVFFDRVYSEVLGKDAEIEMRLPIVAGRLNAEDRRLLLDELPEVVARIQADLGDPERLVEGVRLVLGTVVEMLLARLRNLLVVIGDRFPGIRHGIATIVRDVTRHADFGRLFLADMVGA